MKKQNKMKKVMSQDKGKGLHYPCELNKNVFTCCCDKDEAIKAMKGPTAGKIKAKK